MYSYKSGSRIFGELFCRRKTYDNDHKKTITTKSLYLDGIQEAVINHDITPGDCIYLDFDGNPTAHDVIGVDVEDLTVPGRHSITVQMHDLLEKRPFDTKGIYGSSVWAASDLRRYLNNDEFKGRYETDLMPRLGAVRKMNSSGKTTEDMFFLLSADELDPEKTPYPYYEDKRNRVKFVPDGYTDCYWTRSANHHDDVDVDNVRIVSSTGLWSCSDANTVFIRLAPAFVICF